MQQLQITAPYGYDEIVPLTESHRVLLQQEATPAFFRSVNALAVSATEIAVAGRDYPIVFVSGDKGSTFVPVAVLGLEPKQNLFIAPQGSWDPESYVPAYVRRYPFCISKLYLDGIPRSERVVCVAKSSLREDGVALFDASGAPTAQWSQFEKLLKEYESDLDVTVRMCAVIAKLGLLSPFQVQLTGRRMAPALQGMHRIDEQKLSALKPLSMKALVTQGIMARIYAHLHSLDNFARLYRRAAAR